MAITQHILAETFHEACLDLHKSRLDGELMCVCDVIVCMQKMWVKKQQGGGKEV